jgi:hypothetical protein
MKCDVLRRALTAVFFCASVVDSVCLQWTYRVRQGINANLKTSGIIKELLECLFHPTERPTFTGFSGVRKLGKLLYCSGKPDPWLASYSISAVSFSDVP